MLRHEILKAAIDLSLIFGKAELYALSRRIRSLQRDPDGGQRLAEEVFAAGAAWRVFWEGASLSSRAVLDLLGYSSLNSSRFWGQLVSGKTEAAVELSVLGRRTREFERFSNLLHREAPPGGKGRIQIRLVEPDSGQISTTSRIVDALAAMDQLYGAASQLSGIEDAGELVVATCDSGSDKAFDLLGVAEAVAGLKDLIIEIWDRLVFHKERKADAHLKLIAESLPILARVEEMRQSGALDPEDGLRLRRQIQEGTFKFIRAGVTIPEMERERPSPRALMAPEAKLLAPAPAASEESTEPEDIAAASVDEDAEETQEPSGLSAEEEQTLLELLERKQRAQSGEPEVPIGLDDPPESDPARDRDTWKVSDWPETDEDSSNEPPASVDS